jgi:DNA invertase Pin-like site-specific DNA recombinase
VVWKLDRLGRSLRELIDLVNGLQERGVEFVSLRESPDTTTPGGKLVFHDFASVAEFERDLIRERTMAGLEAARARGHKPVMDEKKLALASAMLKNRDTRQRGVRGHWGVALDALSPPQVRRVGEVTGERNSLREAQITS